MQNKFMQALKATIMSIIVALLITGLLVLGIYLFLGQEIGDIFSLVNKVSITDTKKEQGETEMKRTQLTPEERIIKMATYRGVMRVRTMCIQLGTDEETLSRTLKKMVKRGLLEVSTYGRGKTLGLTATCAGRAFLY